jgi:hypothetical protein
MTAAPAAPADGGGGGRNAALLAGLERRLQGMSLSDERGLTREAAAAALAMAALLRDEHGVLFAPAAQQLATLLLHDSSGEVSARVVQHSPDALPALAALLADGSTFARGAAAAALQRAVAHTPALALSAAATPDLIPRLLMILQRQQQEGFDASSPAAVAALEQIASAGPEALATVEAWGALPVLMDAAASDDIRCSLHSFRALATFATRGGEGFCGRAAAAGAFLALIRALARPQSISAESVWCDITFYALTLAQHLTDGSPERSTWLASAGGAPLLVRQLLKRPLEGAAYIAATVIANVARAVVCCGTPTIRAPPPPAALLQRFIDAGALQGLALLLTGLPTSRGRSPQDVDDAVVGRGYASAAAALALMGAAVPTAIQIVVAAGALPEMVAALAGAGVVSSGQDRFCCELLIFFQRAASEPSLAAAIHDAGAVRALIVSLRARGGAPNKIESFKLSRAAGVLGLLARNHPPAARAAVHAGALTALRLLKRHRDAGVAEAAASALAELQSA